MRTAEQEKRDWASELAFYGLAAVIGTLIGRALAERHGSTR